MKCLVCWLTSVKTSATADWAGPRSLVMPASSINAFPLREGGDHISATLEFLCAHCLPEGPEVRKPPQPKETRPSGRVGSALPEEKLERSPVKGG